MIDLAVIFVKDYFQNQNITQILTARPLIS